MFKKAYILLFGLLCCGYVKAQTDTTIVHSPVKSISDDCYNALIKGDDMYNMAAVAELNHYQMPDKVLKYKKEMDLRPTQISKISSINTELHRKRVEMGNNIITNEKKLDELFKTHKADDGTIIFSANRYGLY